ncbi:hypothetical protein D1605_002765 [Xylella fastidiosa subsp. fastidiosa]|uniref:Uncharacterized protein n=2 Tax=Xylella fastidiosa TaxID=2371 RepID=Q87E17_XYLFT|nr:hypothetical protein [Xylella fastidiosa]AAO28385.1 conserved hypothetical protein [Xylella fastidiosa Temecula1]ACB91972.1 hypothetical protein XfasM23_0528 [Xylella fastidiosa M23]KAF0570846.1 hypothetical protein P305_07630 [Xylella fastidiosa subsp. fastidiosa Mus-1]MBE0261500.1 hypothetical protein [Xylella fastidiosa subsp. fastidiosa]MBE0264208.1 hypothetical protein [Xylella fastidiosa subsp. fastidiosa]
MIMIRKALRRIPAYLPNMRLLVEYVMITSLVSLAAHAVLSWVNHAKLTQRATYIQEQVASMERALNEKATMNAEQHAAIAQLLLLRNSDSRAVAVPRCAREL